MNHDNVTCEVCGVKGPKCISYKEPFYDLYGKLHNESVVYRNSVQGGHREKIIYIKQQNGCMNGYHPLSLPLCSCCHSIAGPLNSKKSIFKTRDHFHKYVERNVMFRAFAKPWGSMCETSLSGIMLYSHYNKPFVNGLVVKIPGSDNPSTKGDILKPSEFSYVIINKVYPKETIPEWASDTYLSRKPLPSGPFIYKNGDKVIEFEYFVEVIPYKEVMNRAVRTIINWWKRVRVPSPKLYNVHNKLKTTNHKLESELPNELDILMEKIQKIKEEINKQERVKCVLEATIKRIEVSNL